MLDVRKPAALILSNILTVGDKPDKPVQVDIRQSKIQVTVCCVGSESEIMVDC